MENRQESIGPKRPLLKPICVKEDDLSYIDFPAFGIFLDAGFDADIMSGYPHANFPLSKASHSDTSATQLAGHIYRDNNLIPIPSLEFFNNHITFYGDALDDPALKDIGSFRDWHLTINPSIFRL